MAIRINVDRSYESANWIKSVRKANEEKRKKNKKRLKKSEDSIELLSLTDEITAFAKQSQAPVPKFGRGSDWDYESSHTTIPENVQWFATKTGKKWWARTGETEKPQTTIPLTPIESFDSPLSDIFPNVSAEGVEINRKYLQMMAKMKGQSVEDYVSNTYSIAVNTPEEKDYEVELSGQSDNIGDSMLATLERYGDTAWGKATHKAIAFRKTLIALAQGAELTSAQSAGLDDMLSTKGGQRLRELLTEKEGWEGAWEYVGNKWIGAASKPAGSVASSPINCNPSGDCAKFCYAYNGRGAMPEALLSSEILDMLVLADPQRAADTIAKQFKKGKVYKGNNALRFFDRGDGSEAWVKVINGVNAQGVRAHVFSKRPEFLDALNSSNVRLLSIDPSNPDLARDNDLPIAFVFTGKDDIPLMEEFKDRIKVILPVKGHGDTATASEEAIEELRAQPWYKDKEGVGEGNMCPIDVGRHEISYSYNQKPEPVYYHHQSITMKSGKTKTQKLLLTQAQVNSVKKNGFYKKKGEIIGEGLDINDAETLEPKSSWTCANCDLGKGKGIGCYRNQTTDYKESGLVTIRKAADSPALPIMSVSNRDLTAYFLIIKDRRAVDRAFSMKPTVTQMIKELGFAYRRTLTPKQMRRVRKDSGVKDSIWTSANELKMAKLLYKSLNSTPSEDDWSVPFRSWLLAAYSAVEDRITVKPKLKVFMESLNDVSLTKELPDMLNFIYEMEMIAEDHISTRES